VSFTSNASTREKALFWKLVLTFRLFFAIALLKAPFELVAPQERQSVGACSRRLLYSIELFCLSSPTQAHLPRRPIAHARRKKIVDG
jgi:hypothetical protein